MGGSAWGELAQAFSEEDDALSDLVRAIRTRRDGADPNRTEMGFMLVITVPSSMSVEAVERDLLSSIEFGQPKLSILWDVAATRPEVVVTDPEGRL